MISFLNGYRVDSIFCIYFYKKYISPLNESVTERIHYGLQIHETNK